MSSEEKGIERPFGMALPEGIRHLHGALYLVKFELLQLPDPEAKSEGNSDKPEYEFRNYRSLTENGQAVLYDKRKSEEMRESIRDKTQLAPYVARWKRNAQTIFPQIVGGERRWRGTDFLRRKKELVKDPRSVRLNKDTLEYEYDYNPADEVYEWVLCLIFAVANDVDALSLSYTENNCRVNQGPGHDVALVMELRRCGATDEKIMEVMTKDEKWLRDTDTLVANLPEKMLSDLVEDRIDREACIEYLAAKEKFGGDVADKAMVVANDAADKDYKKKFERATKKIVEAKDEEEIAMGAVADAAEGFGSATEAKAQLGEATAKVTRTLKERSKEKPTTDKGHVRAGLRIVTEENSSEQLPKSLRHAKIKQHYLEPLADLVNREGKDIDGNFTADTDALRLAVKLIKGIATGDTEALEIVRHHYRK